MKKNTPLLVFLFGLFLFFFSSPIYAQCGAGQTLNTYCASPADNNAVGFEFCPTTGDIARSTIISGTIGNVFPGIPTNVMNLTVYEGASGSGTTGAIVFGPANGDLSGNVITATAPDLCLVFVYTTSGLPTCSPSGLDTQTEVCSESVPATTVSFTAPANVCVTAGVQTGLSGGSPAGGTYSGPGVTDQGGTYDFDPAVAGVGMITITYTNGGSASDTVEVIAVPTVNFTAPADLCIDAGTVVLNSGTPSGGTYSGPGVTNLGVNYSFNPAFAGVGVHTITYTELGLCGAMTTDTIEVFEACGCTTPGESSFFFCGGAVVETNLVAFEVCPSVGMAAQATINAGTFNSSFGNSLTVYEGDSGSGTSGTIVFGPSSGNLAGTVISGLGADKCLIFVSNSLSGVGCQDGFETALSVCGEDIFPSISFTALDDLCIDEGLQSGLTGGFPVGGVYTGTGVTDDGNGTTYSFDPTIAGAGITTITYTQSGNFISDAVEVFALGTVGCLKFTAPADVCVDTGVQAGLGSGLPTGGVYSGPGVTDDGNGMTYSFSPDLAGAGAITITYTQGGNSIGDTVEVFALPTVTFSVDFADLCVDGGIQLSTLAGSPSGAGGVFSGPGVTDLIGGDNYLFDPSIAGAGIHTITYTYTDANGCTNAASDTVEVFAFPEVTLTLPADLCAGGNGGLPEGGTYSGPGVTDDGNGITFTFDAVTAGAGAHTIVYSLTDSNGCTAQATDIYEDTENPVVSCLPPFIVQLDAMGSASITVGDVLGSATDNCGIANSSIDITTFDCSDVGANTITLTVTDISGNMETCTTMVTVEDPTGNCPIRVSPKVYLQGASLNATLDTDGLMRDTLRGDGLLPVASPYTEDVASTTNTVFTITGNDAIVDWVLVQLRDATDNSIIIASKSSLLQRDGDVVGLDGISPVSFSIASGDYFVVVQHRNHLGIMSANTIILSAAISNVDLSADVAAVNGGVSALIDLGNGIYGMPVGDFDENGQVQNTDLNAVIPSLGVSGYMEADMDMNGQIQTVDVNSLLIPNLGKGQSF